MCVVDALLAVKMGQAQQPNSLDVHHHRQQVRQWQFEIDVVQGVLVVIHEFCVNALSQKCCLVAFP